MDGGDEGYAFDFEEVVDDAERAASDFLPSAHDAIPSSSAPFGDRPRDGAGSVRTDAFDETLALIPLPEGADEALRLDFKSRYFDPARALAAKPPGLDPPRKVRPLENTRRFRRLLPANDPARLDVSVSRAPTRGGSGSGSGSSKETNPSAARPRADRDAAAANARDRAAKFRAQGDAARARVPVLDALLAASAAAGGPLSLLARAMEERRQVRVRTRHASGVRGEAVAYLKAFDRHLNLILADVTETSASRGTRVVAGEAGEKERRRPKLVRRTRRLAQIFVRGEQVVLVAVVGDGEGGARDCVL